MKKILVVIMSIMLLAGCQVTNKEQTTASINDLENGIIYYYSGKDKGSVDKLKAIKEVAKNYQVTVVAIDLDTENGQRAIEDYQSSHRDIVDTYSLITLLEDTMYKGIEDKDTLSTLGMEYKYALNLVKEPTLDKNGQTALEEHKRNILNLSSIDADQLDTLLDVQKAPRVKIPYYVDSDVDFLPVMKIVYGSNIRKSISLADSALPEGAKENMTEYLENDGWIGNFKHSDDADNLKAKLANNETFIVFFYGNSCPHCRKFDPVLREQSQITGVPYISVDMFLDVNATGVQDIINEGKHGLTEMKWVPTLVAFKDGKVVASKGAFDWAINNPKAELGYDIDAQVVQDFLVEHGK